jgi:lysophospholipase L1-like esterase
LSPAREPGSSQTWSPAKVFTDFGFSTGRSSPSLTGMIQSVLGVVVIGLGALANGPAAAATRASTAPANPTNHLLVALIGDSTVAHYPAEKTARGWGMYVQEQFPRSVTVTNLAANGRSTKTFIREGRWQKTLALKPDYILIQFGHNDSHAPEKPESTDAATDYRDYLRQYVRESRAAGATPILITPMLRRTYGPDGTLEDILEPYADAMKAVAREENAAVIDLHAASRTLYEQLGAETVAKFASEPTDRTHFNETGARTMAELVLKELPRVAPELAARLVVR